MAEVDPFEQLRAEAARERAEALRLPGRGLVAHLFVPALLFVALAPVFHHVPTHQLFVDTLGQTAFASSTLFLALAVVWFAEQLFPARREWNARPDGRGLARLAKSFVYVFGVTQLTALLVSLVEVHLKPAVAVLRKGTFWPTEAPFVLRVLLAFLLVELCSYWIHRAAHRFRPLWQFHSTHHASSELNGLKALQTHPVDNLVFYLARTLPLMWLGAGVDEVVAALYLGGVLGVLAHANLELSGRGWGLFFNLPRAHSVHHSVDVEESRSNFGCHTVLFDRIFRTYRPAPRGEPVLGVSAEGPRNLWQELAWPFYRSIS